MGVLEAKIPELLSDLQKPWESSRVLREAPCTFRVSQAIWAASGRSESGCPSKVDVPKGLPQATCLSQSRGTIAGRHAN